MRTLSLPRRTTLLAPALLAAAACAPAVPAPEVHAAYELAGEPNAFWWTHIGSQSSAAVWIGPDVQRDGNLPARIWTLSCTLPGSSEPLSCLQGTVRTDRDETIQLGGGSFLVTLRPRDGLVWGAVRSPDDLAVVTDGFF